MQNGGMTKGERTELGQLIRKREKVLKAAAAERSAKMMAEFDAQSAQIYSFDDDKVWKKAAEAVQSVAKEDNKQILTRCRELGIPAEFAPGISVGWYERGQNAAAARRAELRRMAKSRVDAIEQEAKTQIERMSLEAQTAVIASGIESPAAKAFLEAMPPIEALMPSLNAVEIKGLLDLKHRERHSMRDYLE
jgi:hypothetical protein